MSETFQNFWSLFRFRSLASNSFLNLRGIVTFYENNSKLNSLGRFIRFTQETLGVRSLYLRGGLGIIK